MRCDPESVRLSVRDKTRQDLWLPLLFISDASHVPVTSSLVMHGSHLSPVGGLLSWLLPTLPLIKKSESVLAQQLDAEV